MPIIECKSGYVFRRDGEKKKRLSPFLKFILFFLLIVSFTSGGIFLSTKIPNIVGINTSQMFNKKDIYAIIIGSFDNYDDAYVLSQTIKKQGGAGYINIENGIYSVLLSCYANKNDAEKVINNLLGNNIDCEISVLKMASLSIKIETSVEERKIIKDCINLFYNDYQELYNFSIAYDNKTFTKLEVLEELDRLIVDNEKLLEKYSSCADSSNASLIYLKIYLSELIEKIGVLKNCETNFSSEIKSTYFECIDLYIKFRQEIQK